MAHGDRAAVHVEPLVRDAQAVAAVDHLHREGLVQLPQIDVFDLFAGLLEQLRHGEHGTDAHFVRLAAGHREAAKHAHRLQSPRRGRAITPPSIAGLICDTPSYVVSGRMPSSSAAVTSRIDSWPVFLSITFMRVASGTISSLNLPAARA